MTEAALDTRATAMERDAVHPIIYEFAEGTVYSYGVCRLLSYAVAAALLFATAKKLNESFGDAASAIVAMILGGLIGARLGFVLVNWKEPWTIGLVLSSGGSVYFTGLIGGLVGLTVIATIKRRSVGTTFDLATPSVVGAWAVGNVGCFLAGCCVGSPTTLPWGLRFSADSTPPALRGVPVHPAQLYSLFFELAVIGLLYVWPRRFPGELFLRAVVALLAMRISLAVGGVRPDGSSASTTLFAGMALAATGILFALRRKAARQPPIGPPLIPPQPA